MISRFVGLAGALLLAASGAAMAATTAGSPLSSQYYSPSAPHTRAPMDAPPADVIISHAGMEWVWAAPCASMDPSCGAPTPAYGFDNPTQDQWATWASRADLMTAFTDASGNAICASPYFGSGHSHCDYEDAFNGHIWHAYANNICDPNYYDGCVASTTETFYVRGVPEPETYALMLAGLGLVGFIARRRKLRQP